MRKFLTVLFALALPIASMAAEVSVVPASDWRPGNAAQVKAFAASGCEVIDVSFHIGGGVGTLLAVPAPVAVNRQFVENSVAGFVNSLSKQGFKVVDRRPAAVDRLKGLSVIATGNANGKPLGWVSYLVYSDRKMYTVSVYGLPGIKPSDPLVRNYLGRIRVDASVVPGDIERDSPFEIGRQFGEKVGHYAFYVGSVALIVGLVVFLIFRRRASQPPPLPPPH